MLEQSLYAVATGAIVGALFTWLKLPIPAPPALPGILGIVGMYLGHITITYLR